MPSTALSKATASEATVLGIVSSAHASPPTAMRELSRAQAMGAWYGCALAAATVGVLWVVVLLVL
jgi:hypothetical protein